MASDRRAMLEPVTAAASDDPAIAPLRVPVDQQVTIVAILILAYARLGEGAPGDIRETPRQIGRSEEHTSELQSLMRISYAVFCLKKKTNKTTPNDDDTNTYQ